MQSLFLCDNLKYSCYKFTTVSATQNQENMIDHNLRKRNYNQEIDEKINQLEILRVCVIKEELFRKDVLIVTICANFVSVFNLLAFHHECRVLIGFASHNLFVKQTFSCAAVN